MEVPLGHLGLLWGYFGYTLEALWVHFWVMKVALGDLEGFGVILSLNDFGVLMASFRVYASQFSNVIIFQMNCNDFI